MVERHAALVHLRQDQRHEGESGLSTGGRIEPEPDEVEGGGHESVRHEDAEKTRRPAKGAGDAGEEAGDGGQVRPRDPDGVPIYPGRARMMPAAERNRRRSAGEPHAMRLAMDAAVARAGAITWNETGLGPHGQTGVVVLAPQLWGDVVLARKDAPASYHLAVAVDDALQGVSDVVRGQDLFWSTSIHRVLQALLGLPEPTYHHHRLILDAGGRKLSKSTQATSLRELRGRGTTAADMRRMVGLGH